MKLRGSCACGGVTFEVDGEPRAQLYCHCRSCQLAHAAPLVAAALFPVAAVSYRGEIRKVTVTTRPNAAQRVACAQCATKVLIEPGPTLRAVLPVLCEPKGWFKPQMHVQWEDRVLELEDCLPKYLDYPAPFGGSGRMA